MKMKEEQFRLIQAQIKRLMGQGGFYSKKFAGIDPDSIQSQEDFEKLLDFVGEMKFARLGVFAYSQEENTPAGEMENQIPQEIKEQRAETIMRRQLDISLESNREKIGKTLEVLVEERDADGSYIGRTRYDAPEIDNSVIFSSTRKLEPGTMVNVLIEDAFDYDLTGKEVQ